MNRRAPKAHHMSHRSSGKKFGWAPPPLVIYAVEAHHQTTLQGRLSESLSSGCTGAAAKAAQDLVESPSASSYTAATRCCSASNSAEAFFAASLNANHTSRSRTHVASIGQTLVKYR
jgi:hypothetical protein